MKLSVLIPVYNEKYTIEQIIDEVREVWLPEGVEREMVVVDDASTDGTADLLARIKRAHPEMILLRHPKNRGKGAAVRTAVQHATGDVIVTQDADLEYDPHDYARMLTPILAGEADVVYGSRFMTQECRRVLYFWHSLGNRLLTTLSNLLTDLNLSDMETCYKMARAEILKSIPIRSNRFGIEPELTAKFAKRGCRVFEVPISYRGRTYEEGKKITWKDGVQALWVMLHYKLVDDLYDERYGNPLRHDMSATHRFNRWLADAVRPWIGDRVLEIGAGTGNVTRRLLPRQQYTVTDIDDLHLGYLINVFGRNRRVSVGRLDVGNGADFVPFAGQFDTVVCLSVLEHVENDAAALGNIYSALLPGGRACILVPAGPSLFGTLDKALGHYRRYTRAELRAKLQRAGFHVESTSSFNRITRLGWWLNGKVLRRNRFFKVQLKLFDSLVWLWRRVDRFLPWDGASLLAVARKPGNAKDASVHDKTQSMIESECDV